MVHYDIKPAALRILKQYNLNILKIDKKTENIAFLINFLYDNQVLDLYIYARIKYLIKWCENIHTLNEIFVEIPSAFDWNSTSQGYDFWLKLSKIYNRK